MSIRTACKRLVPTRYHQQLRHLLNLERVHWCRVVMNRQIEGFLRSLDYTRMDALEISGTKFNDFGFRSYRVAEYPDYDVCAGPLAREAFDLVIAEQVLEHVVRPDRAVGSVYQMLRPAGLFIVDTPFLLKIHGYPLDLYRWTEDGMRTLLESAGFHSVRSGSWGNRRCLFKDMSAGLKWTRYNPLLHSLKNEPQFPIVVWAFARK
jgi:SAM-dependent methyltransferase